jgi:hypothetical protein
MNERFQELAVKAKLMAEEDINRQISYNTELKAFAEKFAELIVQECAAVAWAHTPGTEELEYSDYIKNKILKHFGVKQDFSTVWNRK